MKFFFQSISWNTNLMLNSHLNIKFQLNCFSKISWNISVKEICGFQKLKISGPEIWDPGILSLRPRDLGLWDLGICDPGTLDPETQNLGTGTLGYGTMTPRTLDLGPSNLGLAALRPRILRAGPLELNL